MSPYYDAHREHGKIVLYLLQNSHPTDEVPYELRGHVSQDDWSMRVPKIKEVAYKFYKPLLEKIWVFSAFISIVIVPLAIYYTVIDNMLSSNGKKIKHDRMLEARVIGLAVFVGTILFFFLPYFFWKLIGRRRMAKILEGWAQTDRANRSPSEYVPHWNVKCPSVFRSSAILTITTPPNLKPSYFHPNAYLPSFVNPPPDPYYSAASGQPGGYYYSYAPNQYGVPRMGVAAGGLPSYDGNIVCVQRYDDVKVPV